MRRASFRERMMERAESVWADNAVRLEVIEQARAVRAAVLAPVEGVAEPLQVTPHPRLAEVHGLLEQLVGHDLLEPFEPELVPPLFFSSTLDASREARNPHKVRGEGGLALLVGRMAFFPVDDGPDRFVGEEVAGAPRNVSPPLSPESCVQPPSHAETGLYAVSKSAMTTPP